MDADIETKLALYSSDASNDGPPPVDQELLKQQILSLPAEIQGLIRVACVTSTPNGNNFVKAFICNRNIMTYKSQMYDAISEMEVVLGGKKFLADFRRLHPAVVQGATKLKVVYITEDIALRDYQIATKEAEHREAVQRYKDLAELYDLGYMIRAGVPPRPPAEPIRTRHKCYPIDEPRYGSQVCHVIVACKQFTNLRELTIDLSAHLNYNGVDKKTLEADRHYGTRITEHVYAAIGYNFRAGTFDNEKAAKGENKLCKLTLVLTTAELSKAEVDESGWPTHIHALKWNYLGTPAWQWLRYLFRRDIIRHDGGFNPAVHLPLTEFSMDRAAGTCTYTRAGYQG